MARAQNTGGSDSDSRALAVVQPPRLPYPANDAKELSITAQQWKALTDAIYPAAKSVDGVMLALNYCNARGLDPFKRCVHIVPMWNSALRREVETVWPGISELRTTASRTGSWAGNDDCAFGPTLNRGFEASEQREKSNGHGGREKYVAKESCPAFDFPEWAQVTVYRIVSGQRVPFVGPKVRFVEVFSGSKGLRVPNGRWQLAPFQMLEKCAEAAALRRAFPEEMGNDYTAEEMEGKSTEAIGALVEHRPVMDGGDVNREPTRDDADEETAGWPAWVQDDFDLQKQNISLTEEVAPLKRAKAAVLGHRDRADWPEDAKAELEAEFDRRIQMLEGAAGKKREEAGEDASEETDQEPSGDDQADVTAESSETAEEEDGSA